MTKKKSQVGEFKGLPHKTNVKYTNIYIYRLTNSSFTGVSVRGGGGAVTAGAQSWGILARVVWQDEVGGHLGGQAWGMGVG